MGDAFKLVVKQRYVEDLTRDLLLSEPAPGSYGPSVLSDCYAYWRQAKHLTELERQHLLAAMPAWVRRELEREGDPVVGKPAHETPEGSRMRG